MSEEKGKTYYFYVRGSEIRVPHVTSLMVQRDHTSRITAFNITWREGYKPTFFHISPTDISAIICPEIQT